MNMDILRGKWMQIRGEVKRQWGKLTDDDLDEIDGSMDTLVGKIQERYGYSRDAAMKEAGTWRAKYDKNYDKGYR